MKISVALCTYNGEKYLSKQLDSILNQSGFAVHEIVVCDDKSTDDTLQIVENYAKQYPEIFKVHSNTANIGSTKNFEKALDLCTGDYIFFSDQDDTWKPNKIEKIIPLFQNDEKIEAVFSNADIMDENGTIIPNITLWDSVFFLENELQKPIDFFDIITKNGNIVTGATLCIKKELKKKIFPFPSDILHDEWIALITAACQTIAYSNEKLISYRIHQNQQIGLKNKNKIEQIIHKKRVILGITPPKTFADFRILAKKIYLKRNEIVRLKKYNFINFEALITLSAQELEHHKNKMKEKYPIPYYFYGMIDQLLGKRK